MEKRKLLRLDTNDFLQITPLSEVGKKIKGTARNITYAGICFCCEVEWRKGDVLLIDYFIKEKFDSVKLKVLVVWSEFISQDIGYFCGGEIIDIEEEKKEMFFNYYFKKIEGRE